MNSTNNNMSVRTPNMYQNGVIDIFKLFKIFDLNVLQVNQKGEISCVMVKEIK
jgi:hypothetical protein